MPTMTDGMISWSRRCEDIEMNQPDQPTPDASWLRTPMTDGAEIASRYDEWAPNYEHELVNEWHYDAPFVAARIVSEFLGESSTASVLDIGCGTGLVGRALTERGAGIVDGVDVSPASLHLADATRAYRHTICHDFNAGPLPFDTHSYHAAICVGVLSYATDPMAVVRELCRVVAPGGIVVFTHRIDLWETQNLGASLNQLRARTDVQTLTWTEPKPYMPGNPTEGDLQIRYVTITTA